MMSREAKVLMRWLGLAVVCVVTSACSHVQPWERGQLARYEMAFEPDPLEGKIEGHIYFSKEASSSGTSTSGGGCGCN